MPEDQQHKSVKPGPEHLINPLDSIELLRRVKEVAEPADQALTDTLQSHVPFIEEVGRYIIFSGGKRLRPVLFLLASKAAGAEAPARLAAIFEYLHAATLLHDDVIDEAGLRRGREAARKVYGNDAVVLVGDFLFSKSYSLAAETSLPDFVSALTDCTTIMGEGQVLELLHTDDYKLDEEGYRQVIFAKTAVLLAASCQMGAIFADAEPEVVQAFYDYGNELGMAFQMVDDALDYVGTQHEFGKPVGHDLAEGKITLPFIYTRDNAPQADASRLVELAEAGRQDAEAVEEAKELVRTHGGVDYTMDQAVSHCIKAQLALGRAVQGADMPPEVETLMAIAPYVVRRRN